MRQLYAITKFFTCMLAVLALFSSCKNEEENIFGKSSADRISGLLGEYEELLIAAPNGWAIEYYARYDDDRIGGFQLLCSFEKGLVTMSANLSLSGYSSGTSAEKRRGLHTSGFTLTDIQGPVLTFDTYNPIIHYFADPSSPTNLGLRGDYEFVIEEASPEKFVMRGVKYKNRIVMRALDKDVIWEEYQTGANRMDSVLRDYFRFEIYRNGTLSDMASTVIASDFSARTFRITEGEQTETRNFVSVPGGFTLYDDLNIANSPVTQFRWDEGAKTLHSVGTDDKIELKPVYLNYEDYPGTYTVYASNLFDPVTVTVSVKEQGKTFEVSEELFGYPFEMRFTDKNVEIPCQVMATPEPGTEIRLVGAYYILGLVKTYDTSGEMYGYWRSGYRENPTVEIEEAEGGSAWTSAIFAFRVRKYVNGSASDWLDNGADCKEIKMVKVSQ